MDPIASVYQSLALMRVPVLPNVRPGMRDLGDNWTGVSDPTRRKKLQNRLNQRVRRQFTVTALLFWTWPVSCG